MHSRFLSRGSSLLGVGLLVACSSSSPESGFFGGDAGGSTGPGTGSGSGSGSDGGGGVFGPGSDAGAGTPACVPNPANYDIPGDNCDNDGDGKVDNVAACDASLQASGTAADFAKALGLCQTASATDTKWGVISATFQNGHVSTGHPGKFDQQHGILPKFGDVVKPREGASLGVLSTGSATEQDSDSGPAFKGQKNGMQTVGFGGGQGGDVPGPYPLPTSGCGAGASGKSVEVDDVINVKLQIRVPANAKGFSFDFDFWSGEWPEYVCSDFNDAFIAYLDSKAFTPNPPTNDLKNMSFDAKGNPVSVNNGFFDRCTPGTQTGCAMGATKGGPSVCPGNTSELSGTGFDDPGTYCRTTSSGGGATGWLTSQAPVQPGEVITLEFMIWDAGDAWFDSTVLLDNFQWVPGPVTTGTTRPPPR